MPRFLERLRGKIDFFASKQLNCRPENIDLGFGLSLLYISDIHLGVPHSRRVREQITAILQKRPYDLVLIGGDLVDSRVGIDSIPDFIGMLRCNVPVDGVVGVVPGNHDQRAGLIEVRNKVITSGAYWLPDNSLELLGKNSRMLRVIADPSQIRDDTAFHILCAHEPNVFPIAIKAGVDLVLAGHLHGGQIIFFTYNELHYPGAVFCRWTGDSFVEGKTRMIVSRGVTELFAVRINCPREVVCCLL